MLSETNIRCFLSVSETLSFTETARRVYLSQQAVSKNILQLENDLGVRLFRRTLRSIELTEAGSKFRDLFLQLDKIYSEGAAFIINTYVNANKRLCVGMQNYLDFGPKMVQVAESFRRTHPEVALSTIRYSPGDLIQKLFSDELAVAVMYRRYVPDNPEYLVTDIFSTFITLLVSADHPLVTFDATYLDFAEEPYIMDVFEGESQKAIEIRAEKEISLLGLHPSALITVPNRDTAYTTAELGGGILLSSDTSQAIRGYRLMRYRTDIRDEICCVCKKNRINENSVDFIRSIRDAYS